MKGYSSVIRQCLLYNVRPSIQYWLRYPVTMKEETFGRVYLPLIKVYVFIIYTYMMSTIRALGYNVYVYVIPK